MSSSAKIHETNSTSQGRFQIKLSSVHHPGCKFEAIENYLGLSGEGIYLIDDTRGHVAAACAAGWGAVQYQSTTQLRNWLTERGLLDDDA